MAGLGYQLFLSFPNIRPKIALFNTLWIVELQMKGKYDKQHYESAGAEEGKKKDTFFFGHNFVLHMEEADLKTDALAKHKQCLGLSIESGSQLLSLVSGLEWAQ